MTDDRVNRGEIEVEALDGASSAYVRALREEHALPALVKARVAKRLGAAPKADRRGREAWVLVGLAAAVVLLLASAELLPRGRGVGDGQSLSAEAASYVREAEEAARAVIVRRSGGVAGGEGEVKAAGSSSVILEDSAAGSAASGGGGDEAAQAVEVAVRGEGGGSGAAADGGRGRVGAESRDRGGAGRVEAKAAKEDGSAGAASVGIDLAGERRALESAWRALKSGDLEAALAAAKRHREQHPEGVLAQEREVIEVIARCRGARPGASAGAEEFGRRFPQSPWSAQIRAACDGAL
jgi:hypothetical protein